MAQALSFTDVAQSYKAGAEMPYAGQEARDEASLLSTKAQEQKLALQEHKQAYGTKMAVMAAEAKFAKTNSDIVLSTLQGKGKMLSILAQDPEIKNNPEAMNTILNMSRDNVVDMQKAIKAQSDAKVEQMGQVHDAVSRAMLDVNDPSGWKAAIDLADPTTAGQLTKLQAKFNSAEYQRASPVEQEQFKRMALGYLTTGKEVAKAQQDVIRDVLGQKEYERKLEKDKVDKHAKEQAAARARDKIEADKKKVEAKEGKGTGTILARAVEDRDRMLKKVEDQAREILVKANVAEPEEFKSSFAGLYKYSALNPAQKAKLRELDAQRARAITSFAEKTKGIKPTEGSSKDTPKTITSEAEADKLPKGTWIKMGDKVGQVQ